MEKLNIETKNFLKVNGQVKSVCTVEYNDIVDAIQCVNQLLEYLVGNALSKGDITIEEGEDGCRVITL